LRNWITDLDCRRVPYSVNNGEAGLEVHEGFNRALRNIWADLADALHGLAPGPAEAGTPNCPDIFFAGHSLGGALAMLAAAAWAAGGSGNLPDRSGGSPDRMGGLPSGRLPDGSGKLPDPPWLYSFGQPRVGNAAFARWYDGRLRGRSFRVVHAEDVVPRVPWLLGGFRHAGTEIFYDALGMARQDWPWWRKAPSDAAGLWREWRHGKVALLGDHHIAAYVELLKADGDTLNTEDAPAEFSRRS